MDYRLTDSYERRLRPLYDALDSGNLKAGNKAATTALSKYPGDQTVRLLQAILFQRHGKVAEALKVCAEVAEEIPTDERVLSTLQHLCRRLNKLSLIREVLEKATTADPRNVGLLRGLFGAYAREGSFAKQQQVATKLQRLSGPEEPYVWWIICSLVLQARAAVQGTSGASVAMSPLQLLKLAEGMILKQKKRTDVPWTYEETMLFIGVLQAQGKHQEALEHVQGPGQASFVMAAERGALIGCLMVAAGSHQVAASHYKSLLAEHPDDWDILQSYLDTVALPGCTASPPHQVLHGLESLLASEPPSSQETQQQESGSFDEALQTMAQLRQDHEDGPSPSRRSLSLAVIELESRRCSSYNASASGVGNNALGSDGMRDTDGLSAAILKHFERFGHLSSCASDLKSYLAGFVAAGKLSLCEKMQQALQKMPSYSTADAAEYLSNLRRHVCFYQVQHWLGLPKFETMEQAEHHAAQLVQLFADSQPLVADLDAKEGGHADELLVLAAASLISAADLSAASPSERSTKLFQALLVIEAGQQRRRVSAPLRLAACFLSSLLAAPLTAAAQFDALDIKHIMHDTVSGHVLLPALLGSGSEDQAASLLDDMLSLYSDHKRDAGDTLMMAYEAGSWTKVIEFVAFGEQLRKSHTKAVAETELCLLDLALHASQDRSKSNTIKLTEIQLPGDIPEAMEFHEDLAVRATWAPPSALQTPLSLLEWWETQGQASIPEFPWWVVARSSSSKAGSSWSKGSAESLKIRHLLSRLLLALEGRQIEISDGPLQQQDHTSSSLPNGQIYSAASQAFTLLLIGCLQQMRVGRQAMGGQNGNLAMPMGVVEDSLQGLCSSFTGLCDEAHSLLSHQEPAQADTLSLHSHGLLAAAALARQQALWLVVVLQHCSRALTSQSDQGGQDAETASEGAQGPLQLLKRLRQSSAASLQKVKGRLQAMLDASRQAQAASIILENSRASTAELWTWEKSFRASKFLSSVVKHQREVAEGILASLNSSAQKLQENHSR